MLLSRALNRGYGMSRYRWPMHFGLLNSDCLWVLDEIQLMGSGLATTTQLQAFREKLQVWGTVQTIWMSATLQRDWLATVDFKDQVPDLSCLKLGDGDQENEHLRKRLRAKKTLFKADASAEEKEEIASLIKQKHQPGTLTLVVINTVNRARELFDALRKADGQSAKVKGGKGRAATDKTVPSAAEPELLLLHSRFRPVERQVQIQCLLSPVPEAGRIVVATQIVEAGVDISAKTLFTELASWPSLVQRFGRCNRFGEHDDAQVFWIEVPTGKKNLATPYEEEELKTARKVLESSALKDVGLTSVERQLEKLPDETRQQLFRYEPIHVVRRKDIIELFDTTPDLAGNDLDISRFIRDGRELDVQVFWREVQEASDPSPKVESGRAPRRNELCPVPFYLPNDEDNDGRLDHLTIYAQGPTDLDGQDLGFEEPELYAFDGFRRLRQVGGKPDLQLVLLGVGSCDDWTDTPLFGRSRRWRSATPFVPPRHHKTRGQKRETPVEQLHDELRRRGFPAPVAVHGLLRCELEGRSIRWLEFRRARLFGGGSCGQGFGCGFVIEFAEPVSGPLCFGYGCHFGLGLFTPAEFSIDCGSG